GAPPPPCPVRASGGAMTTTELVAEVRRWIPRFTVEEAEQYLLRSQYDRLYSAALELAERFLPPPAREPETLADAALHADAGLLALGLPSELLDAKDAIYEGERAVTEQDVKILLATLGFLMGSLALRSALAAVDAWLEEDG